MESDAREQAFAETTPRGLIDGPFQWPTLEDRLIRARSLADEAWQERVEAMSRDWERVLSIGPALLEAFSRDGAQLVRGEE